MTAIRPPFYYHSTTIRQHCDHSTTYVTMSQRELEYFPGSGPFCLCDICPCNASDVSSAGKGGGHFRTERNVVTCNHLEGLQDSYFRATHSRYTVYNLAIPGRTRPVLATATLLAEFSIIYRLISFCRKPYCLTLSVIRLYTNWAPVLYCIKLGSKLRASQNSVGEPSGDSSHTKLLVLCSQACGPLVFSSLTTPPRTPQATIHQPEKN